MSESHGMNARLAAFVVSFLAWADPAFAHAPIETVGGFYGGLLHPVLVPAHSLGLLALGLFIGQQDRRRIGLLWFAVALTAGLVAIALAVGQTPAGDILLANSVLIGMPVAVGWPPPRPVGWLLAAITGATLALDSPPQTISIEEGTVMLIGTGLGACIALAAVIEIAVRLTRPWRRIGARLAGFLIAAGAMLVLAVRIAGGMPP
jgi:urease accessory protein